MPLNAPNHDVHPFPYMSDRVYTIRRDLELLRCTIAGVLQSKHGCDPMLDIHENDDARDAVICALSDLLDRQRTALEEIDACLSHTFFESNGQPVKRLLALRAPRRADAAPGGGNEAA
jgi:hypothetical protein